ncbi:AraC family transcriptional regulator [Nocardiopsis mangrovi]|uniref:AraC family transcriptional regulator n=1 Tax=Nocardiopsis mangrovi TaxID=1179818 RepID=A0ABV9DWD8_9ACTN
MIDSTFTSEDFPREERFDRWRGWVTGVFAPMEVRSEHTYDFEFRQRHLVLGPSVVWPADTPAMALSRTPALIRAFDPGVYHIGLVQRGSCVTDWDGRRQTVQLPGQVQVNDSSCPSTVRISDRDGRYKVIAMSVPRDLVTLPRKLVAEAMAAPISYREGVGALLAGFVAHLAANAAFLRPADASRLGMVLADLVATVLAHAVEQEKALTPEARRRGLLLRAQAFFLANLHDSGLGPEDAAASLHISVRHLHQLFRPTGTTASAWVRAQRLERARRDLADPALAHLSVSAIARRWGYTHPATFHRAFRAAYGTSPIDHRDQMRDGYVVGSAGRVPVVPASAPGGVRAGASGR